MSLKGGVDIQKYVTLYQLGNKEVYSLHQSNSSIKNAKKNPESTKPNLLHTTNKSQHHPNIAPATTRLTANHHNHNN